MMLQHLIEELGLEPTRSAASNGGEYHCPCPNCGGNDRFMFWPAKNRYWCRQCNIKGDAIQFCRDFQGLSFHDACRKTNRPSPSSSSNFRENQPVNGHKQISPETWDSKANTFIASSSQRLILDQQAIDLVRKRGLTIETIKKNRIGWNPVKTFHRRADWGLEESEKQKWICLPPGIVIPQFENDIIRRIKIRRSDWIEGDLYGKYYEIPGPSKRLPIFGDLHQNLVLIVEAELDAILVAQEAGDLCACMALGGAQKRPETTQMKWLENKSSVLFALDFDDAGKKEFHFWQRQHKNLEPWPVPEEKSPGDYHMKGGNIREWITIGIKNYQKS